MTLIYEYDSPILGCDSKTTVEAHPLTLSGAVEVFERFLKGAGFEFDGNISLKNITEPNNCCGGSNDDITLNIGEYGAAQPFYCGYDEYSGLSFPAGVDTITLTGTNPETEYPEINIDLEPIKKKKKK